MNAPPIADFVVGGVLETGSLVSLDASASRDPDRGDAITSYLWSVEADDAPCPPPAVAGTNAVAQVRFGCAGKFRVGLVVLDGKYVQSSATTRAIQVADRSGPGLVDAGPDQSVAHLCSGTPLVCRLAGAVELAATTTAEATSSFRWSVEPPPGRELDARRRVRFLPDQSTLNPRVEIETDGAAISGDWQFRLEVLDAAGVVDSDVVRVSVTNRSPAVRSVPSVSVDHAFDVSSRLFTASGAVPVEAVDEDGDPLERSVAFHHANDGGAMFLGEDLGAAIRFSVAVPFNEPEDALFLRGAEGLDRRVAITATDVNGGTTTLDIPVTVGDRAPVPARPSTSTAAHSYDSAAGVFRAQPSLGAWVDPDGDPLGYEVSAGADCPTFAVAAGGTLQLQCSRAFTSMASLAGFLQQPAAQVTAHDPWEQTTTAVAFHIGNRAPFANQVGYRPVVDCKPHSVWGPMCQVNEGSKGPSNRFLAATFYAAPAVSDPDGDPIQVSSSASANVAVCGPGQPCSLAILLPESASCESTPPDVSAAVVATDGVASSPGLVFLDPVCR